MSQYEDIIHLPRHVSRKRRQMSAAERAAQFSPFAALVGFDAAIQEEARLVSRRIELAEDEMAALDRKYRYLQSILGEKPRVKITYFRPDWHKDGGAYVTMTGRIAAIHPQEQWLALADGTHLDFADIFRLEGDVFGEEL